jgi:hypothetical protein
MAAVRGVRAGLRSACGRCAAVLMCAAAAAAAALSSPARAQWASWDQGAHIREVSVELAGRVRANGPAAVFGEIDQCYRGQEQAVTLGKALEKCLIEDIVHSWVTADVFARLARENPANKVPPPQSVLEAMSGRLIAVFRKYSIPEDKGVEFMQAVRQQGMPAYVQALQPR